MIELSPVAMESHRAAIDHVLVEIWENWGNLISMETSPCTASH